MQPPILPPIAPFGAPPSPHVTATNPGCTNPADQAYAPVSTDQTCSKTSASASAVSSNGEIQHGNQHLGNVTNGTVTQTRGYVPVVQLSGDSGQRLDMRPADESTSTGTGLAKEVFAGSVSHAKAMAATIAQTTPPAVDVAAGSGHPGGLPMTVHIR